MDVMIKYRGGRACFTIFQEGEGIYTASLLSYEGEEGNTPPEEITLIKGVRCWTGSIEDKTLLNELGEFIDSFHVEIEGDTKVEN